MLRSCTFLAVVLSALVALSGCGDGLSEYERIKKKQDEAAASLQSVGGKASLKNYPQGEAWAVDLSGATLSDGVFEDLKRLKRITELNLSKSNASDAMMDHVNEIGTLLLKLDLSQTAVTDAGLEKLQGLVLLMDFNLTGTKVTQAGVDRFRGKRQNDPRIGAMFKSPSIRR
jgi:uncharacterized protein YjbI with pentapeptide repeats